jgi:hypothetical protein
MLVRCLLALSFVLLFAAGPVRSQSNQAGADAVAAAREYVRVLGMKDQMGAILPLIFQQLKQASHA